MLERWIVSHVPLHPICSLFNSINIYGYQPLKTFTISSCTARDHIIINKYGRRRTTSKLNMHF